MTVARTFQGRGLPLDDLIGEGNLGLIRAAKGYDPRYGTRFGTYAGYWIKHAILHSLMNTKSTIRLPVHMEKLLIKWRKARRVLCHQLNRSPLFDEVASHLGLSQAQKSLVREAQLAVRVQTESNLTGENVRNVLVEVSDPHGDDEGSLEAREEQRDLQSRMKTLDDREHAILALHYGLEGEELSLREVGHRLGISSEWARRIEVRAITKLQQYDAVGAVGN